MLFSSYLCTRKETRSVMKKFVLTLLLAVSALTSWAYDFSAVAPTGQTLYYNISGSNVTVTAPVTYGYSGYTEPTGVLTIPSSVTYSGITYSVTSIGNSAFEGCTSLFCVSIPNSVTFIGNSAFESCTNLMRVSIPNSVTFIGDRAFWECSSLISATIPNSVASIGDYAFYSCSRLTSVTIPNSVTSIGYSAFSACTRLTSVTIPNSVTYIGSSAFYGCNALTNVTIPNSVTSIDSYAFSGCSSLTSITCNSTAAPTLGSNVFRAVPSSATIYIPCGSLESYQNRWPQFSNFIERLYNVSVSTADPIQGSASVSSQPTCTNSTAVIAATPAPSHHFVSWSDGNTDNPRTITLTQDTALTAIFSSQYYDFSAVAPSGQTLYYKILSSHTVCVTHPGPCDFEVCWGDYTQPTGDLIIPSTVSCSGTTYSVTEIGEDAFNWCTSLTSVTIPNSVTSIGSGAFSGCGSLISVTIPNSVTSIGDYAFTSCTSLTSATIPNSVTSIGDYAFSACGSLTSVTIPNSVTSIGDGAFWECLSLTSVTIPNSVTSIGDYTFYSCISLTSVTIPNSVTSIGDGAFKECSSLTSVTIPNSVNFIGSAFFSCTSLDTIICKAGTPPTAGTTYNTFYQVPTSCKVVIPCGSASAYRRTQYWNRFSNFIETLVYSISAVSSDSTQGSASVTIQPTCSTSAVITATPAPDCRFRQWSDGNTDNPRTINLTQDTALTAIFSNLYYDFSAVAFTGQTLYYKILTSRTVSVTHPGPCDYEGCWGDYAQPAGTLLIPSAVTYSGTTYSVTEIGEFAFSGCTGLTSVSFTPLNSVTYIGAGAFSGCIGLTSVSIPNHVSRIEEWTFERCTSLTSITIPNSVTEIGTNAFGYCSSLASITIPNSVLTLGEYAFAGCSSLTSITIPNSVQEIGQSAFWDCSSLTSVSIPNSVTFIGDYAFLNCISLTSVSIPNSVTEIYDGTFNNCSSLTAITIPNSVTEIDYAAFAGCSSLTSITCDAATAPALGESAFSDVPSSASVYIPCGSTASYQSAWGEYFSNFIEPASYSITASAADPTQGTAAAVIQPTCTTAVITATPAPDYHFRQWNDGNTDNPRTLTLTQDTSLTAFFSARPQHDTVYIHDTTYIHDTVYVTLFLRDSTIIYGSHDTIFVHDTVRDCHEQQLFVLVNNDTLGACAGSGTYPLGSTVQIMAIPNRGQRFLCWNDGVTTNPRTITLTGNLTFTAIFFKQDD